MPNLETLRECYRHNDWGRDKLLALSRGLSAAQLDQPFEMGPGSLRATLHHLYGAERIWFERWHARGLSDFPHARELDGVDELWQAFRKLAAARETFLQILGDAGLQRDFTFTARSGKTYTMRIGDIALHVCNHGVHHRAQALNMLRHLGVRVPGLDYLYFRAAQPTVDLSPRSRATLRAGGLMADDGIVTPAALSVSALRVYFDYSDWAQWRIVAAVAPLDDDALDRPFETGLGTLRRTLTHIIDAEQWWYANWTRGPQPFEKLPPSMPMNHVCALYDQAANRRNAQLVALTDDDLAREVAADVLPNLRLRFRLGESLLQLPGHGAHHRAQALNMLRRLGVKSPELDLADWLVETGGEHPPGQRR